MAPGCPTGQYTIEQGHKVPFLCHGAMMEVELAPQILLLPSFITTQAVQLFLIRSSYDFHRNLRARPNSRGPS